MILGPRGQRSRSQGHKVHNIATTEPCMRCGAVLLSYLFHGDTAMQNCLIKGDRVPAQICIRFENVSLGFVSGLYSVLSESHLAASAGG